MTDRPSLSQLRGRVFKHSGTGRPEVGNWLARRVGRPSAVYGTWVAARVGLSAHVVTLAALVANLGGAAAIGAGSRGGFLVGVGLLVVAYWLDHVDGQVARWRGTSSLSGVYFDYLMHHAAAMALGFSLGFHLAMRTGSLAWTVAGFLIAAGWAGLGLHNDCRYKAFFQRIKREDRPLMVVCAGGDRPAPPPRCPRRGWGMLSWTAAKACEPHVVLVGLAGLSATAITSPHAWEVTMKAGVAAMAVLAPALAAARTGRTIARGLPDAEFERLFRPCEDHGVGMSRRRPG